MDQLRESGGVWGRILLAGVAGGLAEVAWVALYAGTTSLSGAALAREVTATVFPGLATASFAPALGIVIHMVLAVALAIAFAKAVWAPFTRSAGRLHALAASVGVLAAVWSMNFLVILPAWNPVFVALMPYSVTFASKMLFALSMAWVLTAPVRAQARTA